MLLTALVLLAGLASQAGEGAATLLQALPRPTEATASAEAPRFDPAARAVSPLLTGLPKPRLAMAPF